MVSIQCIECTAAPPLLILLNVKCPILAGARRRPSGYQCAAAESKLDRIVVVPGTGGRLDMGEKSHFCIVHCVIGGSIMYMFIFSY